MRKILFICGSLNQTMMLNKISKHLDTKYDCYFTPYFADGLIGNLTKKGFLDFTVLGGKPRKDTENYIKTNNLKLDFAGSKNNYDLYITCSDLIVPAGLKNKKVILIQEGMTDPENLLYYIVKYMKLPRYIASTSTTGLSNKYDYFCVASEGYKNLFIKKGCKPEKIIVTGIPNFDNCISFSNNDFLYENYVLVCTSDSRETYKYENRKKFILNAVKIADGRQIIFKLHPNEKTERAIKEIKTYAPGSLVFYEGNTNHMIANCDVLITKYSSVVYVGLALDKEVYSYFKIENLKKLLPVQNDGNSAKNIARVCEFHLNSILEKNSDYDDRILRNIPGNSVLNFQ